jgi:CubicO group peptidase (beta-lactamase class C family)
MFVKSLLLSLPIFFSFPVCSQVGQVSQAAQASGFLSVAKNRHWTPIDPSAIRKFNTENLSPSEKRIADRAGELVKNTSLLSLLMIEKGKIVFEHHNKPASEDKHFLSWSMSKTLTAMTVGTAFCSGKIDSLDKAASEYSSELVGTQLGASSIRNLLTMSSGVADSLSNGEFLQNAWPRIAIDQTLTGLDYIHQFGGRGAGFFKDKKPGETFNYSNLDTLALESVVNSRGGFLKEFDENIWMKIGSEKKGSWIIDKNSRAVSYAGFSATTRDWGRLAMWSIDKLKGSDVCMREFMTALTKPQIANNSKVAPNFKSYGYQTWVGNIGGRSRYWWVGYGGQRVGIEPESERIIVVSSWREDYMDQIYELFGTWQKMN